MMFTIHKAYRDFFVVFLFFFFFFFFFFIWFLSFLWWSFIYDTMLICQSIQFCFETHKMADINAEVANNTSIISHLNTIKWKWL